MPTMLRPGQFTGPERKRCTQCGRRLGAQGLIKYCLNRQACLKRVAAKAAKGGGHGDH